jgi:hypothetical protein
MNVPIFNIIDIQYFVQIIKNIFVRIWTKVYEAHLMISMITMICHIVSSQ